MSSATAARAPGVYVEWLDANAQQLEIGRTDVAGFLGVAERGPLHTPVKIESVRQFFTTFGAHIAAGVLAYAVEGFFANGGRACWVVRVADPRTAKRAQLRVRLADCRFVVRASSPGAWGDRIVVEVVWGANDIAALVASEGGRVQRIALPDLDLGKGSTQRTLCEAAVDTQPAPWPGQLVELVRDTDPHTEGGWNTSIEGRASLAGGDDGTGALTPEHFSGAADAAPGVEWGMDALDRIDGVSFVAAPDLMLMLKPFAAAVKLAQSALLDKCVARNDRIALLDLPDQDLPGVLAYRADLPAISFGAAYHPWIAVDDPLRIAGSVRFIPPSGHVAGMVARSDRLRGVHKPPANELLEGVWAVSRQMDAAAHADLNEHGVNAIRALPGRGVLVLGARTLSADARWRFVNVRRLFAMIEEALEAQMQWLAFEPNNPRLWKEIDRSVRGFLERLYRAGMLDGASSADAYTVRCDGSTNPAAAIEQGRVACEMGIQPPYPAEFVVVRIGVTRSGIQVEEKGAQDV